MLFFNKKEITREGELFSTSRKAIIYDKDMDMFKQPIRVYISKEKIIERYIVFRKRMNPDIRNWLVEGAYQHPVKVKCFFKNNDLIGMLDENGNYLDLVIQTVTSGTLEKVS